MTKAEKRKRLSKIVERLKEVYPEAECALHYGGDKFVEKIQGDYDTVVGLSLRLVKELLSKIDE